jgi:hypothetical protein
MQTGMPAEAFAGLLKMVEAMLSPANWQKLSAGLEQPSLAA